MAILFTFGHDIKLDNLHKLDYVLARQQDINNNYILNHTLLYKLFCLESRLIYIIKETS